MNNVTQEIGTKPLFLDKKKYTSLELIIKVLTEVAFKDDTILTAREAEAIVSKYDLPSSSSYVNKALNELLKRDILTRDRLSSVGTGGAGKYIYYLKDGSADIQKYLDDTGQELRETIEETIEKPDDMEVLEEIRKEIEEREEQYMNERDLTHSSYGQGRPFSRMGSQTPFQFREERGKDWSDLTNIRPSDVQVSVRIDGQEISESSINAMLALTDLLNSQFRLPLHALEAIQYVIEGRTYSLQSIMTIVKTYRRHTPRQPQRF